MSGFRLGAASKDERIVFGAQRPGYCSHDVDLSEVLEWISFMKGQGIRRVCCLLPEGQLRYCRTPFLLFPIADGSGGNGGISGFDKPQGTL